MLGHSPDNETTGSTFLFCIPVFLYSSLHLMLSWGAQREKWDLLCSGTRSYGKGSENPKRLGLLLSFNIYLCLVVQECLWFWLGIPFCLLQPWSPSQHTSHRRMQCRTRKLPALWTELIISEELHHEKTCKAHSHHKNLPWVLNWVYGRDHKLFISMPNATEPGLSETSCKPEKSMSWVVSLLALIPPSPGIMR